MDEQDITLLLTLDRTRNLTHAADELYITQSSVSKRVRLLEESLGATLMLRSRHGIQFTPSGEVVLNACKKIKSSLETMRSELNVLGGVIAGTVRAGISVNYATYRLPAVLSEYNNRYPAVDTQITAANSSKIYTMLLANKIDLGIIRGEYLKWNGTSVLLDREHICAICQAGCSKEDFMQIPYIKRQSGSDMERDIAQWLQENPLRPVKNRISAATTGIIVNMVSHGLGWSVVPEICLDEFKGKIYPLYFENGEPLTRSTYLMYSPRMLELPQVRAFIELIRQHEKERQAKNA